MNLTRLAAILLIAAGSLALAYGGFTYTKESHTAKLGPIELNVEEKETVNVPVWAGLGAIAVGVFVLLASRK